MRGWIALAAVYVVGFFLTFGYTYANFECGRADGEYTCKADQDFVPVAKGLIWPVYWAGHGSIKLFD